MSETDTETILCEGCAQPIVAPTKVHWGPFLCFTKQPVCKDCELKAMTEHFQTRHRLICPYKPPQWRPRA